MTDTARVSTARGKWSVALAAGSPVLGGILFFGAVYIIPMLFGGTSADDRLHSGLVAVAVVFLLSSAMVIAAVVLGVASIAGAWPKSGLPGRTTAILLGSIGLGFSALVGWGLVWLLNGGGA